MTLTMEAVVRNGSLELSQPLRLAEGTQVRVTIAPADEDRDPLDAVIGICDAGPEISLAERHDDILYGRKS